MIARRELVRRTNGSYRIHATRATGRPLQHGSRSTYVYGCRCDPCRDAEAVYSQGRDNAERARRAREARA